MAKVKIIEKRVQMGHRDIIKYQLMTHFFINKVQISSSELDCLTLLGACGECNMSDFCNSAVEEAIFKVPQTVRNFITRAEKNKLVVKRKGDSKKKILLNPALNMCTEGNVLLDFKIAHIATQES